MNTSTVTCARPNRIDAEGYIAYMTGERVDRPLFTELFGPLTQTAAEWVAQGARPDELDLSAFCHDVVDVHWVMVHMGIKPLATPQVLEDTPEMQLSIDRFGRRTQLWKQSASIPLPLDYPVKTRDDWERIKPHYQYHEDRIQAGWKEAALAARERGELICTGIPGGFDEPRQLLGEEGLCLALYDDPGMIHDMLATIGDTCERVLDQISCEVPIDHLGIHEDMAGKSGPLMGPGQITEFLQPYYRRCWGLVSSRGTRLFCQDSDGDMRPVMDAFIACGVNIFYPMEPAAGMDIVASRKHYGPKIAYKGGIDKHALRKDRAAIRRELEYKLQPDLRQGGVVFALDHRIPNGVSLDNYRYYVRTAREILGLDPDPPAALWKRMAF